MPNFEPYDEKRYQEILKEVGTYRYQIYQKGQAMPGNIFPANLPFYQYSSVVAGTGATICNYTFMGDKNEPKFTIPKGEQLVIVRLLRYDHNCGNPHYNADDYLIFPTQNGNVLRLKRSRAPDHFIDIVSQSQVKTIAEAYQLPQESAGPVQDYGKEGAKLHVEIKELTDGNDPFVDA